MDISSLTKATGILVDLIEGVPDGPLRLILGLSLSYLFAGINRHVFNSPIERSQATLRHLFNFIAGLSILYLNYADEVVHMIIPTLAVWLILRFMGPGVYSTGFSAVFAFGYLMSGYIRHGGEDYTLDWTTSYCVMCLRLIGFAMDYYDGNKRTKEEKAQSRNVSKVWDNAELKELPTIIETFGYSFCYFGCLVGPQFPFNFYINFVTGKLAGHSSRRSVFKCLIGGVIYMAITQVGKSYFDPSYVVHQNYLKQPFWYRFGYMTLAGRIVMTKYMGVWLFNEGSCTLSGMPAKSLSNVDPRQYELITCLSQVIISFNMNTNLWSKNYVFKRLRFLGNKMLSGFTTMIFLAIWHGFAPAYFLCFVLEFLDIEAERIMKGWFKPVFELAGKNVLSNAVLNLACYVITITSLSYATVAFDLLSWPKINTFWSSMYYYNHIFIAFVLMSPFILPKKSKVDKTKKEE